MTEPDTTDITTRSQLQTRDPESLLPATEERGWIHDNLRSPATEKVARKHT